MPKTDANQGHKSSANGKQENKNITNRIKPKLKPIARTEGLEINDMVRMVDFKRAVNSNYEAPLIILRSDLIKVNTNQNCYFYKENKAYITRGKNTGHYYYSSVNQNKEVFNLDIFDIFEIITDKNYVDIIANMVKCFGFIIKESQDKNKYRRRYIKNIEIIGKGNFDIFKLSYPYLAEIGGLTLINLLKFNLIGLKNVSEDRDITNDNHLFFSSNSYIEEFFNTSKGTVGRHIALFKLLGLIDNVKYADIPLQLRLRSEEERKMHKQLSKINYFRINMITKELLQQAEDIAKYAIDSGLKVRDITMNNIGSIFGEQEVERIYRDNKKIIRASMDSRRIKKERLETEIRVNEITKNKTLPF